MQQLREKNMHPNVPRGANQGDLHLQNHPPPLGWVLLLPFHLLCSTAHPRPLKAELQPPGNSAVPSKSLNWVSRTERKNLIKAWRKLADLLAERQQKEGKGTHRLCISLEAEKDKGCWSPIPQLQGGKCVSQICNGMQATETHLGMGEYK